MCVTASVRPSLSHVPPVEIPFPSPPPPSLPLRARCRGEIRRTSVHHRLWTGLLLPCIKPGPGRSDASSSESVVSSQAHGTTKVIRYSPGLSIFSGPSAGSRSKRVRWKKCNYKLIPPLKSPPHIPSLNKSRLLVNRTLIFQTDHHLSTQRKTRPLKSFLRTYIHTQGRGGRRRRRRRRRRRTSRTITTWSVAEQNTSVTNVVRYRPRSKTSPRRGHS